MASFSVIGRRRSGKNVATSVRAMASVRVAARASGDRSAWATSERKLVLSAHSWRSFSRRSWIVRARVFLPLTKRGWLRGSKSPVAVSVRCVLTNRAASSSSACGITSPRSCRA